MRLILVRHAESQHSHRGIIADLAGCTGLTTHGQQQAQALRERLRTMDELHNCAVHLSSPVLRARQTADIIADSIPSCPPIVDPNLREIVPGVADGLAWQAYEATYASFDLIAEPDRPFAPQGESWHVFIERVRTTLQRLATQYTGRTVLATTHAGFIVAAFLVLFAVPRPGTGAWIDPRHTSLTIWQATKGRWQLERYNDIGHLEKQFSTSGSF